jgi:uncharacterized membrane protein
MKDIATVIIVLLLFLALVGFLLRIILKRSLKEIFDDIISFFF